MGKFSYTVAIDKQNVSVTWSGAYQLIGWYNRNDYGNRCSSAGAEWDRYQITGSKSTKKHELMHHDSSYNYLTSESVKNKIDNLLYEMHSVCFKPEDRSSTQISLQQELVNYINGACDAIKEESLDADDIDTKSPYDTINVYKDCANVPLEEEN